MPDTINPKIEIPLTTADKVMEAVSLLLLAAFWYFTLSHFKQLPDIIPAHFRSDGSIDGYGTKWTIIFLPIVGSVFYLGLSLVSRYPHKMNHFVTITEANAAKQYAIMARMFRVMKITLVLLFFLMAYTTVQVALGLPDLFGRWFLLLLFTLIFAPLFYFLIQSSKNA
jgi:uncharacterized membrane protein